MKKLSKEAKFNLKNGFGSLISNRSVIEAGKNIPWWVALIVGLISAFLPIVPIMVNTANMNGASSISGTYNYGFDRGAALTMVSMQNDHYRVILGEDKNVELYQDSTKIPAGKPVELYSYINTQSPTPTNQEYKMRTFFIFEYDDPNTEVVETANSWYSEIYNQEFLVGTTQLKDTTVDPAGSTYYKPNLMIFYKEGFTLVLYKNDTTSTVGSFGGDYINVTFTKATDRDLIYELGTVEGITTPTTLNFNNKPYEEGVLKNFQKFMTESYLEIKGRTLLYSTTIYYAVYVGMIVFLGFLMFLLTRGKRNFNNYLKVHQCLRMGAWAAISPGILALALGFLLSNYALMFFILFFGVRVMWMSMKQLSPNYQG